MKTSDYSTADRIVLVFEQSTLKTLMNNGHLHASDFRCVDKQSKKSVWTMLRSIAAKRLNRYD